MSLLIGLQAGHQNIKDNPDPVLASETGAAGEEPFNVAVRDALSPILQNYGFQVQLDDANANNNPNTVQKDFAFYLAIHAEGAPAGGNVVAPDQSVDASNEESRRIVNHINDIYFADTDISNNGLVTNNETFYYMWNALSAKTPCGIIECGDLADPHDSVILADHKRVALGIAHGLCNAFGIAWNGEQGNKPAQPQQPKPPKPTQEATLTLSQVQESYYLKSAVDQSMHLIDQALELPDYSSIDDAVKKIIFYKNKPAKVVIQAAPNGTTPVKPSVPVTDKPSTMAPQVPQTDTPSNTPSTQANQNQPSGPTGFWTNAFQFLRSLLG